MPPIFPEPPEHSPRLIVYHQTHHEPSGELVPIQPLLNTPLTHLILAAIHLNHHEHTPHLTLNDDHPSHAKNDPLWPALRELQNGGIKVMGMLGGAAKESFAVLDRGTEEFERYYKLLHDFVTTYRLDGLDLDVEEPMSLAGIVRLIDRLKDDFGDRFIITLAPVAPALTSPDPRHNLSGFDYPSLEASRGHKIAWYNTQFYCGWGSLASAHDYLHIITAGWRAGWDARKIVLGAVTNDRNGSGFVELWQLVETVFQVQERLGRGWGGVMGWEYFNALPGGEGAPWEWAETLGGVIGSVRETPAEMIEEQPKAEEQKALRGEESQVPLVKDVDDDAPEADPPKEFEYFTETSDVE